MSKTFMRICSLVVTLAMMVNMLPVYARADDVFESLPPDDLGQSTIIEQESQEIPEETEPAVPVFTTEEAEIIEEVAENRTEFSKDFKLSNGLHMVAVYPGAVHFEKDGEWEDIDNTLILSEQRSGNVYTNTAGSWQVSFPQEISGNNSVVVTEGDYTVRFAMVGQLRNNGHVIMKVDEEAELMGNVSAEMNEATLNGAEISEENLSAVNSEVDMAAVGEGSISTNPNISLEPESEAVTKFMNADVLATGTTISAAKVAPAKIEKLEKVEMEDKRMEKVMPDKLSSRLRYDDIFTNTDVIYDLGSNLVKESIVMAQYEANLRGFSYILETGSMIAVLTENNDIELYDPTGEELIMVMPAPYLFDSAGEYSFDVDINLKKVDDYYALSYILPQSWMADENRVWPVTLDPALEQIGDDSAAVDYTVSEKVTIPKDQYISQIEAGYSSTTGEERAYIQYTQLPMALTSADVIVEANITLMCVGGNASESRIEVHEVTSPWTKDDLTWGNQPSFNSLVEDYANVPYSGSPYKSISWEITDLVRKWYTGDNNGLVFKLSEADVYAARSGKKLNYKAFYSTEFIYSEGNSVLTILYRNNNGLESYWDYTATSAGRAGTGYVNQYTGNLVWVRNVMGFGGNLMPVDINLIYNANDTASNTYGIGYGWRTNYNQSVSPWTVNGSYYVWQDGDGTKHYFKNIDSDSAYEDEDGLDLELTTGSGNWKYCITDKMGNKSYFDDVGRLIEMTNNQELSSSIQITYVNTSSPKISTITDGVGRKYEFGYSGANLSQIVYTSKGTEWVRKATFTYSSSQLTKVTDHDGGYSTYGYGTNHLLTSVTEQDGYKLKYTYNSVASGTEGAKMPRRVIKIEELDGTVAGGVLNFSYAQNQTTITDYSENKQVIQFNTWGNTISVHDGQGRAQMADYTSNKAQEASEERGNQLTAASKMQNTVKNILSDTSFESSTMWYVTNTTLVSQSISPSVAYHGAKSLALTRATSSDWSGGVYSSAFQVQAGESCTFSAYVMGTAYLEITDNTTTCSSGPPATSTEWTRLEANYTNTSSSAKNVYLRFMTVTAGTSYMDCVQFEKMPTASRYNLVQNSDFSTSSNWSSTAGKTSLNPQNHSPAAPQLDLNVYMLNGNTGGTNQITQTVKVSGNKGDSFVLAGWSKANAVPFEDSTTNPPEYAVIAEFKNTDGTTSTYKARFNPYVDISMWQYTAAMITTTKAYSQVTVRLAYDYNANTAYFDGIQLYKEEFGESYEYDPNTEDLRTVADAAGGETKYEYDSNHNVKKITFPNGDFINYTYDNYHNVLTAKTAQNVLTTYTYDAYGNLLTTKVGSDIITRNTYTTDNNYLATTVDASGKTTTYTYNTNTGTLTSVKYPNDNEYTQTNYEYDNMQRLAEVNEEVRRSMNSTGVAMSANYAYDGDYLTSITTPSTTYTFGYGNFGLRNQVSIGEHSLASYEYTYETVNNVKYYTNYLKSLAYGNQDSVQYTYNQRGDVTEQRYYEDGNTTNPNSTVTFKYNNSGYLASTYDSATGLTTTYYYDLSDRLTKYAESSDDFNHIADYEYDKNNNLTQLFDTILGTVYKTYYYYDTDNRVNKVYDGGLQETYTYDSYGRLESRVSNISATKNVLNDEIEYESGTARVSSLNSTSIGDYNVTHTYTYDDNGNILTDSYGGKTTSYVYDSANQLIRENNQAAGKTWVWTHDNAGNIVTRKEYTYTTGAVGSLTVLDTDGYLYDDAWGDLLEQFDGKAVESDEIGNITRIGTNYRIYNWKHGRQLASSSYNGGATWTYSYNADGMRYKRTSGNAAYTYYYNGDLLRYLDYDSNTTDSRAAAKLYFVLDATGKPISVSYRPEGSTKTSFYFYVHNLQGDVVALVDHVYGNKVVEYTYDAWGNVLSVEADPEYEDLAELNPFRYRSYVYDEETELYYLQSRYYDPEMGRFINADVFASTGQGLLGNNMFAYCGNNPVCFSDPSGHILVGILGEASGWLHTKDQMTYDEKLAVVTKYEELGVEYIPSPSGNGGQILNSHLIKDGREMTLYSLYLIQNTDDFSGSVEGMVFEWWLHNVICDVFQNRPNSSYYISAKDVDLGRTIYDDRHGVSKIMWAAYSILYPEQAKSDLYVYWDYNGG